MHAHRICFKHKGKRLPARHKLCTLLMHQRIVCIDAQHALRLYIREHLDRRFDMSSLHDLIGQFKRSHLGLRRCIHRADLHRIQTDTGFSRRLCRHKRIALRRHTVRDQHHTPGCISRKCAGCRLNCRSNIRSRRINRRHVPCGILGKFHHANAVAQLALRCCDPRIHLFLCRHHAGRPVSQHNCLCVLAIERNRRARRNHSKQDYHRHTQNCRRAVRPANALFFAQHPERQQNKCHSRNRHEQHGRGFKHQINISHDDTSPIPQAAQASAAAQWRAPDRRCAPAPPAFPVQVQPLSESAASLQVRR